MEPFKALTLIAAAGAVSLVGAGAFGFYVGYKSGKGSGDAPVILSSGNGSNAAVSLRPVLDDIRALSKQVETLSETSKASAPAASDGQTVNLKPVLDEIRTLGRQVELMKAQASAASAPTVQSSDGSKVKVVDHAEDFDTLKDQLRALNAKLEKQEPRAPKALIDEIRSLSASIQSQEPSGRRAVIEEIRTAVNTLQNAEPKASRTVLDEIRSLNAAVVSLKPQDRAQASITDQLKVLTATVESLKARVADGSGSGADVAELKNLMASVSDQVGKCQVQLASVSSANVASAHGTPPQGNSFAGGTTTVAVSQTPRQEPAAVVFFDNVTLRKDQEKQYDEIGVRLSLQSITPRQVKLAVNRQGVGLAFGERKVFRSQDVECELNLMETNLNDSQARVSLSCKR